MEKNKFWDKYNALGIGLYLYILGASIFSVTDKAQEFKEWRDNYLKKFEKTEIGKVCNDLANIVGVSTAIQYGIWTPDISKNIIKK